MSLDVPLFWISQFFGLFDPEEWNTLFAAIQTLIILIGIPLGISNLRVIVKQQYQDSLMKFMDEMDATQEKRKSIYRDFPKLSDYSDVDPLLIDNARSVMSFLNRTALLIEQKMLPRIEVLSLTHTVIIRCWYILEDFAKFQETEMGTRYGRRVAKLDALAKKFHDIRPHQRPHLIRLARGNDVSIIIYQTNHAHHLAGHIQRIIWRVRYICRWY